jgi:hypothetical protein
VTTAFAAQGIVLHVQLDETDIPLAAWPNSFTDFDVVKAVRFGTAAERADPNWIHIEAARRNVFRYCIFGDQYGGTSSSGLAEIGGNDCMVTLGAAGWVPAGGTADQQAGTFMHEFGHCLGLRHGGSDNTNYKPNYHSVMSYTWQLPNTFNTGQWGLVYSDQAFSTLDEGNLDETAGMGGHMAHVARAGPPPSRLVPETGGVDWDKDGDSGDTGVMADINRLTASATSSPNETLTSQDDWSSIDYNFRDTPDFADGVHINSTMNEEMTLTEHLELDADCPAATVYCTPKTNSLGCVPIIEFTGTPSMSGPDDFVISAREVLSKSLGILVWSTAADDVPFAGGRRCVALPLKRLLPVQNSAGSPHPDCLGTYSSPFTQAYMASEGLTTGSYVFAQYYSRDPLFAPPNALGLTAGVAFVICQ